MTITEDHLALARWLPDGSADPSFGTDGTVIAPLKNGRGSSRSKARVRGDVIRMCWMSSESECSGSDPCRANSRGPDRGAFWDADSRSADIERRPRSRARHRVRARAHHVLRSPIAHPGPRPHDRSATRGATGIVPTGGELANSRGEQYRKVQWARSRSVNGHFGSIALPRPIHQSAARGELVQTSPILGAMFSMLVVPIQ